MFRTVSAALLVTVLPLSAAAAEDHIPGPEESSSPSELLASAQSGALGRAVKQREARVFYRALWTDRVEDARYLGRTIPLDIASVDRTHRRGLALDVTLWEEPAALAPESVVVFFAEPGAMAPRWAAYQATSDDGSEQPWALYRYDQRSGAFDLPVADASLEQDGRRLAFEAQRDDAMPRRLVAFVETRSGEDEDWAWKDQAPTRRRGLMLR